MVYGEHGRRFNASVEGRSAGLASLLLCLWSRKSRSKRSTASLCSAWWRWSGQWRGPLVAKPPGAADRHLHTALTSHYPNHFFIRLCTWRSRQVSSVSRTIPQSAGGIHKLLLLFLISLVVEVRMYQQEGCPKFRSSLVLLAWANRLEVSKEKGKKKIDKYFLSLNSYREFKADRHWLIDFSDKSTKWKGTIIPSYLRFSSYFNSPHPPTPM